MRKSLLVVLMVLVLGLAACGGEPAPVGGGETAAVSPAEAGETVFNEVAAPACNTCHSLEPGQVLVGPSLANIGAQAGSRVSGQSAEDYLYQSVLTPNDFVVEGFSANIMPETYASQLTEQQVDDLVAYMLTLK